MKVAVDVDVAKLTLSKKKQNFRSHFAHCHSAVSFRATPILPISKDTKLNNGQEKIGKRLLSVTAPISAVAVFHSSYLSSSYHVGKNWIFRLALDCSEGKIMNSERWRAPRK